MEKGQIFSLDFLLSIAVVMMALGLVLRAAELASYDWKDREIFSELKGVAENSGNLLVASPEINCRVRGIDINIMNCVDTTKISPSNAREKLAIPAEFGYSLTISPQQTIAFGSRENKDFVETRRKVLLHNGDITKQEYNTTFRQQEGKEVSIQVWRE